MALRLIGFSALNQIVRQVTATLAKHNLTSVGRNLRSGTSNHSTTSDDKNPEA